MPQTRRARVRAQNMEEMIGIKRNLQGEYRGRCSVHMDAMCWVKRDSYLPQGSQGLKSERNQVQARV